MIGQTGKQANMQAHKEANIGKCLFNHILNGIIIVSRAHDLSQAYFAIACPLC